MDVFLALSDHSRVREERAGTCSMTTERRKKKERERERMRTRKMESAREKGR